MEKPHSNDIDQLLQELEEESGAQKSPPPEVEELLQALQSGSGILDRRDAAKQLGSVATSSPRIVRALIAACESDPHPEVNRAAAKSVGDALAIEQAINALQPVDPNVRLEVEGGRRVARVVLLEGVVARRRLRIGLGLPDGSRVNVIIPPLAIDGMSITDRPAF